MRVRPCIELLRERLQAYRIAGGAPAGIINPPGEEGCRTMRTMIKIMTMHGNSNTAPSGTETFELPFSRMRLLKKDSLGTNRSFSLLRSSRDGRTGVEGIRLMRFLTNPMAAANPLKRARRLYGARDWTPRTTSIRCHSVSARGCFGPDKGT